MKRVSKYIDKICLDCDKRFTIRVGDVSFYESIGKIKDIEYCPSCRILEHPSNKQKRGPSANPLK